jgi:hypothetical protein
MALAAAIQAVDFSRRRKTITYKVTFSGNYTAGGDTLNLTTATNPKFLSGAFLGYVPTEYRVCNDAAGYGFEWVPGTTLANGKLKLWSSANTELAAGAYNAALTGDSLLIEFSVKQFVG